MASRLEIVAKYGDKYQEQFLREYDKHRLTADWWEALKFFFGRAFYGGRPDRLSEKYQKSTETIIANQKEQLEKNLSNGNWGKKIFEDALIQGGVKNNRDRKMVIETLDFVSHKPEYNLVKYSLEKIVSEKRLVKSLFNELNGIYNVGEKKTALFLRDLVVLFGLENHVSEEEQRYLQPIDTWVHKVAKNLGLIVSEKIEWEEDSRLIVKYCLDSKVPPIKFNQGAWYIGIRSLDILLENLERLG